MIGIADPKDKSGRIAGYATQESANSHVTEITNMFSQAPDAIEFEFLRPHSLGWLILIVDVEKCAVIISTQTGEIYVRRNAQNIRLRGSQQVQELAWRKGQESYASVLTEELEDFIETSNIFKRYKEHQIPQTDGQIYLRKEKLVREGRATVAAVMLFHDNPQATVTQGSVKIYKYNSIKDQGVREELASDPITIEGPARDLVYRAVETTVGIIENIEVLGAKGFEKIKYPREAIHEVICNAIIHRDYSIHDYVHVRVFDNIVEVESPGRLAGHITIENILDQRFARNKKIVRILNKFPDPPNKDVGEGLNTAFNSMRNMDLREPLIEDLENSARIILAHEPLASKEKLIEQYLERRKTITNTIGREVCFEPSESKMRKMFQRMIDAGVLEKVPDTRGR